ncbi:hypothetical protein [Streptomyces sp. TRM68367]|uniref:hypothetical protein n=1 Tax=Streptomyces sp. TRM68367 TaxID=2758415 RepID=UPI00165AF3B9|nr:hypothetical protein [Streptomyces sp. TRM68367]MBC9729193.1 hypothetical protein [Streptomyces sp. TRM68367]
MDDATANVRVPLIAEEEADGRLAELYDEIKKATDLPFVPDMFCLASTRPDLMAGSGADDLLSSCGVRGRLGRALFRVSPHVPDDHVAAWCCLTCSLR